MRRTTCPECGNEKAWVKGVEGDPVHYREYCGFNGADDCDWEREPETRDTGMAVRTDTPSTDARWYRENGYKEMGVWIKNILQEHDYPVELSITDEAAVGVAWAEPVPDPLPQTIPDYHRTGTVYDNESTVMRNDVVEPLRELLGVGDVLHEVRHQRNEYHTDLVYVDVDPSGVVERESMFSGDEYLHESLTHYKVWWWLYEHAPATRADAVNKGQYADKYTNKHALEWLLSNGYAAESTNGVVVPVQFPRIGDLHAVELKISDWREALEQADRANEPELHEGLAQARGPRFRDRYGYADYRWVVLDAGAIRPALENIGEFEDAGVGLIGVAENGSVVKHLDAEYEPRERYTRDRAWVESQFMQLFDENDELQHILRSHADDTDSDSGDGTQFSLTTYS